MTPRQHLLTSSLFMGITLLLFACEVENPKPRLTSVHPQPVQQRERVTLYGANLGSFTEGNYVLVGTACAELRFWQDDAIGIIVPTGIGTGLRNVAVHWGSGTTLAESIEITGDDLPEEPSAACSPGLISDEPDSTSQNDGAVLDGVILDVSP